MEFIEPVEEVVEFRGIVRPGDFVPELCSARVVATERPRPCLLLLMGAARPGGLAIRVPQGDVESGDMLDVGT